MDDSPIGLLIIDAERRAQKKPSQQHTSQALCGCLVEASWFSLGGRRIHIERCLDHVLVRSRNKQPL